MWCDVVQVAIAIQKIYRAYEARRRVQRLRVAVTMQRLWRAYAERKVWCVW